MREKIVSACIGGVGLIAAVAVGTTVAVAAPSAQTEYIQFLSTDANGNSVVVANGPSTREAWTSQSTTTMTACECVRTSRGVDGNGRGWIPR